MSSYNITEQNHKTLPGTEETLVQYLSGCLVNEASEDEDILQVTSYMLEFVAVDKPDVLEHPMAALSALLQDQLTRRENTQTCPKLQRLDKVFDMSKACSMSNTIALLEGVDLGSINKGKCINDGYVNFESDVTKLEGHLVLILRSLRSKRRGLK